MFLLDSRFYIFRITFHIKINTSLFFKVNISIGTITNFSEIFLKISIFKSTLVADKEITNPENHNPLYDGKEY